MVRAVLPRPTSRSTWFLIGYSGREPSSLDRAAPLTDDTDSCAEEQDEHDEGLEEGCSERVEHGEVSEAND